MEHNIEISQPAEHAAIGSLPPESLEKILSYVDGLTLATSIPRVSKQFKELTAANGALWQSKCKAMDVLDFRNDISWKKQFLDYTGHLFPIYGYTIGSVDYKELLKDPRATPVQLSKTNPLFSLSSKPYCLEINGMEFNCSKLGANGIDTTWSSVEFTRGISDPPAKWKSMGIDLDWCLNDFYMLFLLRHSNMKVWHYRHLLGTLNARISSIVKEGDLYFEIFVDIRAEGEADKKMVVLQKGAARSLTINYNEDLAQEYPQRVAASAEDVLKLRQELVKKLQGDEVAKQLWIKVFANLRCNNLTLKKKTIHDLTLLIKRTESTRAPTPMKNKELLTKIMSFMVHEDEELQHCAGQFFIAFLQKFPKDAGLISKENLWPDKASADKKQTTV